MKLGSLVLVVLGFSCGVKADSDSTVTVETPFADICGELDDPNMAAPYTDLAGVTKCLTRLTAYQEPLKNLEREKYLPRYVLDGKLEALETAISQVPDPDPLTKDIYAAATIKEKVEEVQGSVEILKSSISSTKTDVERERGEFATLVETTTRFKSFAWLTTTKKYYHTSFAPGSFRFIFNDKTICFRSRSIALSDARVIDPNIDPKIIPDAIQYVYPFDFTPAQIVQFTKPYLHSLTHSMLDKDTCLVSYHGKPDEKRLNKIYDHLYKTAPQFLGHFLLSSSCYVKWSEAYESKKIIESLSASKLVLRSIDSGISDYLKGKTFIFGSDSIESIAKVVKNSILPSAAVKTLLANHPWAVDIVDCKIHKAVRAWAVKPTQESEFSTVAIICLGTELGAVALLVLYLLIRPF